MASTVKNFTYYRTDTIVKERRFQHQTTSLFLATLTGAGVYYAKQQEIERNGDTDDSPDAEAVISDMETDVNMPFVLNLDKNGMLDLVAKTVMRKKDFKTRNQKLRV